ncbi:MAG: hypothetical protein ABL998_08765 [Planctomycetota bacterium]
MAVLTVALCAACANLRGEERSTVSTSQNVASAYWFRGVPRSLEAVTQGDLVVNSPFADGSSLSFTTWYNGQLTNGTGDATFPDGYGGQATEIDLVLSYARDVGALELTAGMIGYHFPGFGPSTKEAWLGGTFEALGLSHALTAYYDVDLLDDYYLSYQASRGFPLDERWSAALSLLLGYMSNDQAEFYFGRKSAGLSDLLLSGSLSYAFDENTSVFLKGAGVTVPDDELADSLDQNGFEEGGLWLALGAAWGL